MTPARSPRLENAPLRADAARNRRAVLQAARELFTERGLDTSVEEVAERAAVGVGTVYRHFPSKALLVDAVFEQILLDVSSLAEDALSDEDPWRGLTRLLEGVASLTAANTGLRGILRTRARESERLSTIWAAGADRIERLVRRAQRSGAMRDDVGLADVRAALWAAAEVADTAGALAPDLWRRHLHLVLDGLRAGAATPMPAPSVARSRARAL